jgi:hypothetical protein
MIRMRCFDSDDRTRWFRRRLSLTDAMKSSAPTSPDAWSLSTLMQVEPHTHTFCAPMASRICTNEMINVDVDVGEAGLAGAGLAGAGLAGAQRRGGGEAGRGGAALGAGHGVYSFNRH